MKRDLAIALALPLAVLAAPAWSHAFLDHAAPTVGSVARVAPSEVRLVFTQQLEPAFSTLQVLDAGGKRVDNGDARVDRADATVFAVSLPPLPGGKYHVKWRVLSVDTHVTEGDYTVEIAP